MAGFSRRSFFRGLLGALGALFGAKAAKAVPPAVNFEPAVPQSQAIVNPVGHRTTLVYDCSSKLVSIGGNRTTTTFFVGPPMKAVITDPLGNRTTCFYDSSGQLASMGVRRTTLSYSAWPPVPQGTKGNITCRYDAGMQIGRVERAEPTEPKRETNTGKWRLWREGAD
jgi:hypothetical protein